jgi:hypothetical protein
MRQLLFVPMFTWALFSFSCQKSESKSESDPVANAVDSSLQSPTALSDETSGEQPATSDPSAPRPSTQPGPGASTTVEPAPTEGVTSLSIFSEGAFLIGHRKQLRAIARYKTGLKRDVPAQWSLVTNEADAALEDAGRVRARKKGKLVVRAQFGGQVAEAEFRVDEPILRHKEDQFWVYRLDQNFVLFNTPWDKVPGHGIIRSPQNMPGYAKNCLEEARQSFSVLQNEDAMKERFGAAIGSGATSQLIYMVNVVPQDGRRNDLRRQDRDAYFWHWTREDTRPSLAMSRFQQGSWVWEVIASPGECLQPDAREIQRYLDYVIARLAHVQ